MPKTYDIDKLALIEVVERKLLFVKVRGNILNPGGKRERKPDGTLETYVEALVRELKEETTVDIIRDSIVYIHTYVGKTKDGKRTLREVYHTAKFNGTMTPAGEVEEFVYLTSADIGPHHTPATNDCLLRCRVYGWID